MKGAVLTETRTYGQTVPRRAVVRTAAEVLAVLTATLIVFLPSLINGIPPGDSHMYSVSWTAEFARELAGGTLYPRWLPGLWSGAGGADFYFYAPLPFYAAALLDGLCGFCDATRGLVATGFLFHVLSGLGMLGLLRAIGLRGAAPTGAVAFVMMPYHVANWAVRQAVGEHAAMAFVPFLLWGLIEAVRHGRHAMLTVAVALIGLTHLPTLVVMAVIALPVLLVLRWPPEPAVLARIAGAGALGLGMAAIYWVPAVALLGTVNAPLLEVFDWRVGMIDVMLGDRARWAGYVHLLFVELSVLAVLSVLLSREPGGLPGRLQLAVLGVCWFFVTPVSVAVWQHTPIDAIQFPWRFFLAADVAFAIALSTLWVCLAGAPLARRRAAGLMALAVAALFAAILAGQVPTWWRASKGPFSPAWAVEHRIGASEWLGRTEATAGLHWLEMRVSGLPAALGDERLVRGSDERAEFEVLEDRPRLVRFRAACHEPCQVVVRRSYWSFWTLRNDADGTAVTIRPAPGFPLVSARLPAGEATYRLELARPLIELVGAVISAAALLLGLALAARSRLRRRSAP